MKWMKHLNRVFFCLLLQVQAAQAGEFTVAVAANFTATLDALVTLFEAESGHTVQVTSGSSGVLFAQVTNGAPFDIFLSADSDKPAALVADGLAEPDSLFTYASGVLVLWSADPALAVENAAFLRQTPGRARIAMANPRLAPYGAAALQVLEALEARGMPAPRIVQGQNITQAYQFTASGNVTAGFVALSQVQVNGIISEGAGWIVPQELYDPIRQDAVLLHHGAANPAAREFLAFLKGPKAREIIATGGYRLP